MHKKIIETTNAPQAIGPYSQAVRAGSWVFCSGQIGIDPQTGCLVKGFGSQVRQALCNLEAILQKARLTRKNIVKTTVYVTDMENFPEMNNIYAEFFQSSRPARATIGVFKLPKGAFVEIDAIAIAEKEKP